MLEAKAAEHDPGSMQLTGIETPITARESRGRPDSMACG